MTGYKKYLLLSIFIYLIGMFSFVCFDYYENKKEILHDIDGRLVESASSIPIVVGEAFFHDIISTPPSADSLQKLERTLGEYADIMHLEYLYVMNMKDNNVTIVVSGATKEEIKAGDYNEYEEVYDEASPELRSVFTSKQIAFEEYTDKWGRFRSAFIPWKSPDGKEYVLGADFSVSDLNNIYLKKLFRSGTLGIYFLLLAAPFAFFVIKSSKQTKRLLEDEVKSQTNNIAVLNDQLSQRVEEAEVETQKANTALQEAETFRVKAEQAKREGMLEASSKLEEIVQYITGASEALSVQIEQSNKGAQEQSDRLEESAAAMEEMNATVLEVARNSSESARSVDAARNKAQDGNAIVFSVIEAINNVHSIAFALKNDMDALGKQAVGIGQIVNVISDIADQTNLLALNAAIEAARAGETGRGFAVVADEVRKLAEKTQTATKEVEQTISAIQSGTQKNIENVETAVKTIESANSQAAMSGQALEEIVQLVQSTSDQIQSIATASEQQSATSEEINRSLENVATISSHTAQAMQQSIEAVDQLTQQTTVLRNMIAEMQSENTDRPLEAKGGSKILNRLK